MTPMRRNKGENSSVLFFGRNKCKASEKILSHLKQCGFEVTHVKSKYRGEKLPEDIGWWNGDFILCFRSLFFLPKFLLEKAKVAAINFHPAPPEYPGSGCINFALYDESDTYGVTAHIMNEKIDNGKILEVRRFPVHKNNNLPSLLERTHNELLNLCLDFISNLAEKGTSFIENKLQQSENIFWNGEARKMEELERLQIVNTNVEKSELEKIIRATYIKDCPPKIILHGYEFLLNLNDD
tara:strand:- start:24 stop:740 length:717 start_codon:yes stop_codon:yes gene_type:complete